MSWSRRRKFSDEIAQSITLKVLAGTPARRAAAEAGVSEACFTNWRKWGWLDITPVIAAARQAQHEEARGLACAGLRDNAIGQHLGVSRKAIGDWRRRGYVPPSPRMIGEKHPRAKHSEETVQQVRELIASGVSYGNVAKAHGMTKGTVFDIIRGRRRKEVAA